MKLTYAVVFEQTPNNYCAYIPDLPGCISTGRTWDKMLAMIKEAIAFHIEGMHEDGDPIPPPRMSVSEALTYHKETIPEALALYPVSITDPEEIAALMEPAAVLEVEVEVDLEPSSVRWSVDPLAPAGVRERD